MSNLLIVESLNDKYFIEGVIRSMQVHGILVQEPIVAFEEIGGLDPEKLKRAIRASLNKASKAGYPAIGMMIDMDDKTPDERLGFVNEALKASLPDVQLEEVGRFVTAVNEGISIEIGCWFTNVDGRGNLETVLRRIAREPGDYTSCLAHWQKCLEGKGKALSAPEYDKFWVQIFQRYDKCTKNERKQAGRKCNNEVSLKEKGIYDYQHEDLKDLRDFLTLLDRKSAKA